MTREDILYDGIGRHRKARHEKTKDMPWKDIGKGIRGHRNAYDGMEGQKIVWGGIWWP